MRVDGVVCHVENASNPLDDITPSIAAGDQLNHPTVNPIPNVTNEKIYSRNKALTYRYRRL